MIGTTAWEKHNLRQLGTAILWSREPEDVFGGDAEQAKKHFRKLAKLFHTDIGSGDNEVMLRLNALWREAETYIKADTYGCSRSAKIVKIGASELHLLHLFQPGAVSDYHVTAGGQLLSVPRNPSSDRFMENEVSALNRLNKAPDFSQIETLFPTLMTSERTETDRVIRQINVLQLNAVQFDADEMLTMGQISAYYAKRLHPRHVAWIWRKLLFSFDFMQANKVTHGGINPDSILIHPTHHLTTLIDWSFAALDDKPLMGVNTRYKDWYPREVFDKRFSPGLDLYMAGQVMKAACEDMPDEMARYFQYVTRSSSRPTSAHKLLSDFDTVIYSLYGKREFFPMSDLVWPLHKEIV